MKVQNMISKNGNRIANQFIVEENGIRYFQSYNSIIIKIENGKVFLDSENGTIQKLPENTETFSLAKRKKKRNEK
jgi:hypothetical protein